MHVDIILYLNALGLGLPRKIAISVVPRTPGYYNMYTWEENKG